MRKNSMNRTARCRGISRCLVLLAAWLSCHFITLSSAMAFQQPKPPAVEPAAQQPPPNNWFNVSTPGVAALARPDSFLPYQPPPPGTCCGKKRSSSHIHRLIAWATYCPKCKNRVFSFTNCCNSCQYKGVLPLYLIHMMYPKCVEGSGLHATVPNQCYRGCKGCAAGAAHHHP